MCESILNIIKITLLSFQKQNDQKLGSYWRDSCCTCSRSLRFVGTNHREKEEEERWESLWRCCIHIISTDCKAVTYGNLCFLLGMVPGLLNLGNTCFLNSLLQGLAACPSFIGWLEKFSASPMVQSCKDNQLSRTLLQLLKGIKQVCDISH